MKMGITPKMVGMKVALSYSNNRIGEKIFGPLDFVFAPVYAPLVYQRMSVNIFFIAQSIDSARLEGKGQPKFTTGRWNPHHSGSQIATANDATIRGWDVRTMRLAFAVASQTSTGLQLVVSWFIVNSGS